jgi:hypothetical protein
VQAKAQGKAIKDPFSHFSHTFTNGNRYLRIVDVEYYARFRLSEPFTGLMYMAIFILTADQWPTGLPLGSLLAALQNLGLGVAVAYINRNVVDVYTWSNRPLSAVESGILDAIRRHTFRDLTLNAVYYIVGENIMVWDEFYWDDSKVWANDPTQVYP